jgi:hypothetical protein
MFHENLFFHAARAISRGETIDKPSYEQKAK